MLPHRITAKLFLADDIVPDPQALRIAQGQALVPLFHRWIQNQSAPGLLIDVADYAHVHQGPGVLLIGHEGDYALDFAAGRAGFLYRSKRQGWRDDAEGADDARLEVHLRLVLANLLHAAAALQTGARAAGATTAALRFRPDEIEWTFPDRLSTPNNPSTFEALSERLTAVLSPLLSGADIHLRQTHSDPRFPLTITATLAGVLKDPWPAMRRALGT